MDKIDRIIKESIRKMLVETDIVPLTPYLEPSADPFGFANGCG